MITRFALFFAALFFSFGSLSQIHSLAPGAVPTVAGTQQLLAQRHKALRTAGTSSDKEVYLGVPDLNLTNNRVEGELSYNIIIHFTLQYSPITNSVTSTSNINGVETTIAKNNLTAVAAAAGKTVPFSEMNFMELQIRTQNATSSVDVTNLTINGQSINGIYTRANNPGTGYWHLLNYNFGSGFTITGTITLTGSFGSSADANKVELTLGSQPVASPLPIVWGDISVKRNAGGNNEIRWTTLQEHNSESFLIQRSEDGRAFKTIGRKAGQRNSSTATHYVCEDAGFSKDAYYRLIQTDVDGGAVYSRIVSIKNKSVSSVVYNGSNVLFVQSTDGSQKNIKVVDASGRVFVQTTVKELSVQINVGFLARGIYFVRIEGTEGTVLRFFKQ